MYDGLYYEHIKKVSVYDGLEQIEIPKDEITFEEESLVFKHCTRLELVDFPYVSIDSESIELESVEGRVLNQVIVTFDFDADREEARGRWVYNVEVDPLEVRIVSCSDEQVLELYKEDLEEMILDEMRHGLEIEQEELDVSVE
jgi:hypothetical protein